MFLHHSEKAAALAALRGTVIGGGSSFSVSAMDSNGQVLNFHVFGRYLLATAP